MALPGRLAGGVLPDGCTGRLGLLGAAKELRPSQWIAGFAKGAGVKALLTVRREVLACPGENENLEPSGMNRTPDLLSTKQALYRLSYDGENEKTAEAFTWRSIFWRQLSPTGAEIIRNTA